jgi:hypothetical protein
VKGARNKGRRRFDRRLRAYMSNRLAAYRALCEGAIDRYWDRFVEYGEPRYTPFSYTLVSEIESSNRGFVWDHQVSSELQEVINLMNAWARQLAVWAIWIEVLDTYPQDDRLTIELELVYPAAFMCMLQPAAMRDRFGRIATNGIHQANLLTDASYKDSLVEDTLPPGRFLSRRVKEGQLERLGARWPSFTQVAEALRRLDDASYRKTTSNFRNASSHWLGPRFSFGYTQIITRSVGHPEAVVQQPDGTYVPVIDKTRRAVSYTFGGVAPISHEGMLTANAAQHGHAVAALSAYERLVSDVLVATST